MIDDLKQCETCPWPLDCCTEDGAPKPKPVAVDCPREHEVWERRLGDKRLALLCDAPMAELPVPDHEEELVLV
jgi:hypothetical protein